MAAQGGPSRSRSLEPESMAGVVSVKNSPIHHSCQVRSGQVMPDLPQTMTLLSPVLYTVAALDYATGKSTSTRTGV